MRPPELHKSADTVVYRWRDGRGLRLVHYESRQTYVLNAEEADAWVVWDKDQLRKSEQALPLKKLLASGLVLRSPFDQRLAPLEVDPVSPVIGGKHVKWYEESPELLVLFNTLPMPQNNPLLVLGSYGSLCWRGIIQHWPIGRIREETLRVFGSDESIAFLKRLADLGFIRRIPELERLDWPKEKTRKEFLAPRIQFELTQAAVPWYCLWEICTTCDLSCQTCYLPNFDHPGPTSSQVMYIINEIDRAKIFYVTILGGEPLLRNDLDDVVALLRSQGIFVKVITNGQSLTLDRAKTLARAGLNQVEISFDGLDADSHSMSRGEGTFAYACQAVGHAQDAGIPRVGIVWTVHSGNIDELDELPVFMRSLNVRECYISTFRRTGLRGGSAPFRPLSSVHFQMLRHHQRAWQKAFPDLNIALPSGCSCGRTSVVIGSNGDLRVCSFEYRSFDNIYRTPLSIAWRQHGEVLPDHGPAGYCRLIAAS